ncbi:MAG: MipA/OmpV family protein [Acidobacteria bacterium]|nr:MipA/OmpV family protein [Acidobacteriota bacterium]
MASITITACAIPKPPSRASEYEAPAAWNLDINLTAIVDISSKWHIVAIFNRSGFGKCIEESPVVDRSAGYGFIGSLNRKF